MLNPSHVFLIFQQAINRKSKKLLSLSPFFHWNSNRMRFFCWSFCLFKSKKLEFSLSISYVNTFVSKIRYSPFSVKFLAHVPSRKLLKASVGNSKFQILRQFEKCKIQLQWQEQSGAEITPGKRIIVMQGKEKEEIELSKRS